MRFFVCFLVLLVAATSITPVFAEMPPRGSGFSRPAWETYLADVFADLFPEMSNFTHIVVFETDKVYAETHTVDDMFFFMLFSRGLIELADNEDEIIAVLSHEIGHVKYAEIRGGELLMSRKELFAEKEFQADEYMLEILRGRGKDPCAGMAVLLKVKSTSSAEEYDGQIMEERLNRIAYCCAQGRLR